MPAKYVVRTQRGKEISGAMTLENAEKYAEDYLLDNPKDQVYIFERAFVVTAKAEIKINLRSCPVERY